ncbi:ATP-binding protein [Nocardiopsis sp. NRRL B-16309]|uniref:sensor histidine kinase n=1 Tax=Nocardiopsis sp. NRRL B-16309 TaxID=1519494 RepID=UPI0006ADB255|nr:ATP-binding protein [Nocardiopsis sp. NRRL B-16309]KOX23865.1 histidine kinase [Nocardiopsis sp. NRRL B-16309]
MTRGELRIYLGAAPGVGKTHRMLEEAHRRRARGEDVVVGLVEPRGRADVAALAAGLETVPRRTVRHLGSAYEEMDLAAVLARSPRVVLVDDLAHTNAPGSGHQARRQDIDTLLDAGIDVVSTVDIRHMESLSDVVRHITGAAPGAVVPDSWVRQADQIELVDAAPEALRHRSAQGRGDGHAETGPVPGGGVRPGDLIALRELALLWLADQVDGQLDRYRDENGAAAGWRARERVVVALAGGPEGDVLVRRAARVAARSKGADLMAVHVADGRGLAEADPAVLARQRVLVEDLGGTFHHVLGNDVPTALIEFARGVNATQLVLGASRRSRLAHVFSPGVGVTTLALSGSIDVHLIAHEGVRASAGPRPRGALSLRRRITGFALALAALPLLALGVGLPHDENVFPSGLLLVLALVTTTSLVGGMWPALLAAVAGFLTMNFLYTEPYRTLGIDDPFNMLALAVFLVVAVSVSVVVDKAARRTREAALASAEAGTLAAVAGHVLSGSRPLEALLEQLRETFALDSVALLERRPGTPAGPDHRQDPNLWTVAASVGERPGLAPGDGDVDVPIDDSLALVLSGRRPEAADRRIIEAFAAQSALALRQGRLADEAAAAKPLAEADRMRTALLAAVSHDLRAPLASAKASVTSLRSREVSFGPEDQEALLATADESLDRLTALVSDLLDMSRLQAGVMGVRAVDLPLRESVLRVLDQLGPRGRPVRVDLPEDLAPVRADPGLLERVLANVVDNALRFSPPDRPPTVTAAATGTGLEIRIIDHGPGVPESGHGRMFVPFQRLGDTDHDTGLGLGLALSRGLVQAMDGTMEPDTTPGGGLTMRVTLPRA